MASSTNNYSLTKPAGTDLVDIDVLNENFDKIDIRMKVNADAIAGKQSKLTFDSRPIKNSTNPATSGGIYSAIESVKTVINEGLSGKVDKDSIQSEPVENSTNPISAGAVFEALEQVQDSLVFDDAPAEGSENPVKSSGIKVALDEKQDLLSRVPEIEGLTEGDFLFVERAGEIFKCRAEKLLTLNEYLIAEDGEVLTTETGEMLSIDIAV